MLVKTLGSASARSACRLTSHPLTACLPFFSMRTTSKAEHPRSRPVPSPLGVALGCGRQSRGRHPLRLRAHSRFQPRTTYLRRYPSILRCIPSESPVAIGEFYPKLFCCAVWAEDLCGAAISLCCWWLSDAGFAIKHRVYLLMVIKNYVYKHVIGFYLYFLFFYQNFNAAAH